MTPCLPRLVSLLASRCAAFALMTVLPVLSAANTAPAPLDFVELKPQAALQPLLEKVRGEAKPLGMDPARKALQPGDGVTVLASLMDAGVEKQWLIDVEAVSPTPEEAKQEKGESPHWFTTMGNEYVFSNEQSSFELRTWGPFGEGLSPADEAIAARVRAVSDFLGLGFDRQQALLLRLRKFKESHPNLPPVSFTVAQGKPIKGVDYAQNKAQLAERGFLVEDERCFVGTAPARLEFFMLAMRTPGLQTLLREVSDLTLWTMLKSINGTDVSFQDTNEARQENAGRWSLPEGTEVYSNSFLIVLNRRPILLCRMATTAPRPPLTASAGIVGLALSRPDGKGPRLYLQVVGARQALKP